MSDLVPKSNRAITIRAQVGDERRERLLADALRRSEVSELVVGERKDQGRSWRKSPEAVAPEVSWPTYVNRRRTHRQRKGLPWERLPDGRLPPPPTPIPADIRSAACMVRRADPSVNTALA